MRRPPRLRRHWSFERLERRILLSGAPNPVGINPVSSVSGDFNRDGALDVVTADEGSNDVTILLGNGDGTFQTPRTFPAGVDPIAVTADDFNGDGRLDLAVVDQGDPNTGQGRGVSILLGNGDGTFQAPVLYDAGITPTSIVAGYFEGADHPLDLAVAGTGSNGVSYVSILQDDGFGGFHLSQMFALGDAVALPKSIVAGDFEGADRPLDLAVANSGSNNVSILLGNGDGTFQAPVLYDAGITPTSIVAGDFEGADHPLDLAVAGTGSNGVSYVSILQGDGFGGFHLSQMFALGDAVALPKSLVAGDFEGADRPLDLAVANSGSNNVTILLGDGQGEFQVQSPIALGDSALSPISLVAGDFEGADRPLDLAVANSGSNNISILLGDGQGGFQVQPPIQLGQGTK
ncbi:MAG: VCBS repeat-containing protein, partial [Planctomycetaceae bacterium]|nr:VCBS repeat-containing protein [Planctomycetaceae bacterium]